MSFYEKDSVVTFRWVIAPNASPPVKADFDITLIKPDGVSTYVNDGITTYTAPTTTLPGKASFNLNLALVGHYQVTLSIGTDAVHISNAHREIYSVIVPDHVLTGAAATTTQGPQVILRKIITVGIITENESLFSVTVS